MDVGSETPIPENNQTGSWLIQTASGRSLRLGDLATLHKWIIERRVGRDDRLTRDNQGWRRLGDLPDLVPFFEIVDSAERARPVQETPPPAPLPAPLAVPVLHPPPSAHSSSSLPRQTAASGTSSPGLIVPAGAIPGASTERDETVIIRIAPKKSLSLVKLLLTGTVAAGVAYAGILWQHNRLLPAILHAVPNAPPSAAATPATEQEDLAETAARGPKVRPIAPADEAPPLLGELPANGNPQAPALHRAKAAAAGKAETGKAETGASAAETPQAQAAQGYLALHRHQYLVAIRHFREALTSDPSNGTALFGLADAYRNAGQRALALETYQRYVDELPSGPDAEAARAHVRALEGRKR